MNQAEKYLLEQIDKLLDDSKSTTRYVIGAFTAFATAVLAAKSRGTEFIANDPERLAFSAILIFLIAFYVYHLFQNLKAVIKVKSILKHMALENNDDKSLLIRNFLDARPHLKDIRFVFVIRILLISVLFSILWLFMVDLI